MKKQNNKCGVLRTVLASALFAMPFVGSASLSILASGCSNSDPYIPLSTLPLSNIDIDNAAAARAMLNSDGSVNESLLQASLDAFDRENDVQPYIIASAGGESSSQVWTLKYGEAAGEEKYGTVYKSGIANGFDAVNYAIKALPSDRDSKYKVRVDSDLYSGEESGTDGVSTVSSISNLYSIALADYTILDFHGHTLYANNAMGDNIVPVSLTNVKYCSVRNLTVSGHARYAIWAQGVDNCVFDTIAIELDGSSDSKNLGLRIAEKGTTWSSNIYVDNITASGCYDQAVETMKVDGIYIGTVTATDCNDCGLLLNTTTNAVVGTVNGTRCSPRSSGGVYAALRTANFVGSDVYVHKVNADSCGRAYFCVSACAGISIDEVNAENCYAQGILLQDAQNITVRGGTITAGGNTASSYGIQLTNGSSGGTLSTMDNTFKNIAISGYSAPIFENEGNSDWNTFIDCTSTGGTFSANSVTAVREEHTDSVLEIPAGTTEIADGEYMNYTAIKSVVIPSSVTSIGKNAFAGCASLESVTFEENSSCVSVGDCAFSGTAITEISFPESVASFGSNILPSVCTAVEVKASSLSSMGTEAFFTLSSPSKITFASPGAYSGHTYTDGSIVYGASSLTDTEWVYWYGYTRSTLE
ncbi:MAG: leucine-rich repeat protein [Treponema sp.]|nr:leucine-rich repeat protein [Treponema sp.]